MPSECPQILRLRFAQNDSEELALDIDQRFPDRPMNYPIVRYRFECAVQQPLQLPLYSGSIFRGAFGAALRRIACVTGRKVCDDCPVRNGCSYTAIFEPATGGPDKHQGEGMLPYVIEPPPLRTETLNPEDQLVFHMVLFGRALAQLPLIILAWQQALARGLGKGRARARLSCVSRCNGERQESIWREQAPDIPAHEQLTRLTVPAEATRIRLRMETLLRLQRQGKVLGAADLTPVDLMASCLRRARLFLHGAGLAGEVGDIRGLTEQAKTLAGEHNLHPVRWSRYSSRQQQKMDLPGLVGDWRITGELQPFLPSLYLCELLHVGKNVGFGLGKYVIHKVT